MLQTCRARKILNLRLFADPDSGKAWDKSVTDLGLEVLCVSQVGRSLPFNISPSYPLAPFNNPHSHSHSPPSNYPMLLCITYVHPTSP